MKILDRGYWVSKLFLYQSLCYYVWYSLRYRSLLFFSACNPAISFGGMLDERKSDIYKMLPQAFYPLTYKVQSAEDVRKLIASETIVFPFILKPDIGYKGHQVNLIENSHQLSIAFEAANNEVFLAQEFVDYKREYSLMYYKYPTSKSYGVNSLIEKTYPFVIGDGSSTLKQLITALDNAFVDKKNLIAIATEEYINQILPLGKKQIIEKIGNYSRGAKFHSLMEEVDGSLIESSNRYFSTLSGLDFFRVDFKSNSLKDYMEGRFKILEINGAKSEPLHIYDKQYSIIKIVKDIHDHWMKLNEIVQERRSSAYTFPATKTGWASLRIARNVGK